MWDQFKSWEEAEASWDARARRVAQEHPVKGLKNLPKMEGITSKTASNLKWKAFKWMVTRDTTRGVTRQFLKHPLRYSWRLVRSLVGKNTYRREGSEGEGDFFLYNVSSVDAFRDVLSDPDSILLVGFSYCHKPFECPSKRFSVDCRNDCDHPVCQQCFIGKVVQALPDNQVIPLFITTVHYVGESILKLVHGHPNKKILFMITACELTLNMFADWGNMARIQGLGVRLDGRICNNLPMFAMAEGGIKPGLTVVSDDTQRRILDLIRHRRERSTNLCSWTKNRS